MTERDICRAFQLSQYPPQKDHEDILAYRKITNHELHKTTGCLDMETILRRRRIWRWLGHVLRKPSDDMTKVALRWTPEGKRKRGRPKTTWRRTIEGEMKTRGYSWNSIEKKANNRDEWTSLVLATMCHPAQQGLSKRQHESQYVNNVVLLVLVWTRGRQLMIQSINT